MTILDVYIELLFISLFVIKREQFFVKIKLRNVPFTLCIFKERGNLESSFHNFLKWPMAISTCALLFFVVKLVKIQNK